MAKKLYIKPETIFMEIKESISLLAGSGSGEDATTISTEEEVYFQSKRHNSWSMNGGSGNYNPWTAWDE